MRVTYVLGSYPRRPIGGYRVIYEHANGLARRGHAVTLLHCAYPVRGEPVRGVTRRLRSGLAYRLRRALGSRPDWMRIEPSVRFEVVPDERESLVPEADFVFATAWRLSDAVLGYPASKGRKAYLYQHYEDWSGPRDAVDATWRAPYLRVAVSSWLREVGTRLGAGEVHIIPNGIDAESFRPMYPITGRSPVVSMMYSSQPWKGSEDGLAALEYAKAKVPAMRAVLFGVECPGRRLPRWMEFCENPSQRELSLIYSRSAAYLCSSHAEGFALPPAEAMSCGAAVVTTDCGGNSDFAVHGETVLMSPPGDSPGLARHLVSLLHDATGRESLARRGQNKIAEFTWPRSIAALESLLLSQMRVRDS